MSGWANIFPRIGFVIVAFFILAFVLPSPVLADHDKYPPNRWEDREIYFYQGVYPYRPHWHHEEIPPPKPLERSRALKKVQEQNKARALKIAGAERN